MKAILLSYNLQHLTTCLVTSFQSKSGDAAGYLTALGVGYFIRQVALVSRPTIVVDRWGRERDI